MNLNIDFDMPMKLAKQRVERMRTMAALLEELPGRDKQLRAVAAYWAEMYSAIGVLDEDARRVIGPELIQALALVCQNVAASHEKTYKANSYGTYPMPDALRHFVKLQATSKPD